MRTSAAHELYGSTIGSITKPSPKNGSANDDNYALSATFAKTNAHIPTTSTQHIAQSTTEEQNTDNLSHLEANPWIQSLQQQVWSKLASGKISDAINQISAAIELNNNEGLELAAYCIDRLQEEGYEAEAKILSINLFDTSDPKIAQQSIYDSYLPNQPEQETTQELTKSRELADNKTAIELNAIRTPVPNPPFLGIAV